MTAAMPTPAANVVKMRKRCTRLQKLTPHTGMIQCERCLRGTLDDHTTFTCMGKLAFLYGQYEAACSFYIRAGALHVLRHCKLTQHDPQRYSVYNWSRRLQKHVVNMVVEHEPVLVFHLGHAWHCVQESQPSYASYLRSYSQELQGLAVEPDESHSLVYLHFHNEGFTALQQKVEQLLMFCKQYQQYTVSK